MGKMHSYIGQDHDTAIILLVFYHKPISSLTPLDSSELILQRLYHLIKCAKI